MNERQQADHVNDLMQPPPVHAAEALHHCIGRRRRQHRKAEQGDETDGEIKAQHDLACDLAQIVALIGNVEREMRGDVKECADPDHAPHIDQVSKPRDPAQRRHGQREQ